MKKMQWSDSLSVGVELIDEQHKSLIQRLNDMSHAIESAQGPGEIAKTLDFLIDYALFHFSTEEKHMKANAYPAREDHIKKHGEFRDTLSNLEQEFKEEGATQILADSIDTFLINWLTHHISRVDVEFGAFLKKQNIVLTEEGA